MITSSVPFVFRVISVPRVYATILGRRPVIKRRYHEFDWSADAVVRRYLENDLLLNSSTTKALIKGS